MKFFKQNAEISLLEKASELQKSNISALCLFFHLSRLEQKHKSQDHNLLFNLVNEALANVNSFAYLCADNDLFIVVETTDMQLAKDVISKIRFYYSDDVLTCGGENGEARDFVTVYNVREQYEDFFFACNNKMLALKKQQQDQEDKISSERLQKEKDELWLAALQSRQKRVDKLCMLIVEDQDFSRQLLKSALGREHVSIAARSVAEGIDLYFSNAPDIVFLDIEFPEQDGFCALNEILKKDPRAFVVMTTADNTERGVRKAITGGAKGYIVKPFRKSKIDEYINLYKEKFKSGN